MRTMSNSKPNVVGIEILKQNGLDVDELIKQLVINSSVEFTAYYYFTLLRANCTGMEGEGVKGVIEDARMEDLSHFESCIERIYQLGGSLPKDPIDYIKMSGCEFLQLGCLLQYHMSLDLFHESFCKLCPSLWLLLVQL